MLYTTPIFPQASSDYPEQKTTWTPKSEFISGITRRLESASKKKSNNDYQSFAEKVIEFSDSLDHISQPIYRSMLRQTRAELHQKPDHSSTKMRAMSLVRHAIFKQNGLKAYPTQIIAANIMLDDCLAEMQTGEGKSLAILIAASTAALSGIPVHVITANDYLAQRDAEESHDICKRLDIQVGAVISDMESEQRRNNYALDITFCTAKEVVFDYLRDNTEQRQNKNNLHALAKSITASSNNSEPVLRGLPFAIIDEADSILLDEALTPFILSKQGKQRLNSEHFQLALEIATQLREIRHFEIHEGARTVSLTDQGQFEIMTKIKKSTGLWQVEQFRTHLLEQALAVLHLFHLNKDYLIKDGEIQIIDSISGRVAEGRKWSQGIHQLIELKEGLEITDDLEQMAKITYQQFFPRYLKLGGTSGTVFEDRTELFQSYALAMKKVSLRRPCQRKQYTPKLYLHSEQKWAEIVTQTLARQASGQAILIAVESVADSHILSQKFELQKIKHVVLNARQDEEEASIISNAGQSQSITIATNMAGRGTDIKLSKQVLNAGGLHIIRSHLNASRRIDRQVEGRCARNGQPGSVELILSLEDRLVALYVPGWIKALSRSVFSSDKPLPQQIALPIIGLPQTVEKWRDQRRRGRLKRYHQDMKKMLSIGGTR